MDDHNINYYYYNYYSQFLKRCKDISTTFLSMYEVHYYIYQLLVTPRSTTLFLTPIIPSLPPYYPSLFHLLVSISNTSLFPSHPPPTMYTSSRTILFYSNDYFPILVYIVVPFGLGSEKD